MADAAPYVTTPPLHSLFSADPGFRLQRLHSPITRRHASYKLPYLAHQEVYTAQGLDPVFSPDGFDSAWTQYQAYLLYNVNQMIEGMGTLDGGYEK